MTSKILYNPDNYYFLLGFIPKSDTSNLDCYLKQKYSLETEKIDEDGDDSTSKLGYSLNLVDFRKLRTLKCVCFLELNKILLPKTLVNLQLACNRIKLDIAVFSELINIEILDIGELALFSSADTDYNKTLLKSSEDSLRGMNGNELTGKIDFCIEIKTLKKIHKLKDIVEVIKFLKEQQEGWKESVLNDIRKRFKVQGRFCLNESEKEVYYKEVLHLIFEKKLETNLETALGLKNVYWWVSQTLKNYTTKTISILFWVTIFLIICLIWNIFKFFNEIVNFLRSLVPKLLKPEIPKPEIERFNAKK